MYKEDHKDSDFKSEKSGGDDMINVDSTVTQHHYHQSTEVPPAKSKLLPLLLTAGIAAATGGAGVALAPTALSLAKMLLTDNVKPDIITPTDGKSTSFIKLE